MTPSCSPTSNDLTSYLTIHDSESRKLGLKVSSDDTKLMHAGQRPHPLLLVIGFNSVGVVSSSVCLGLTVTNSDELKPEIDRKRA